MGRPAAEPALNRLGVDADGASDALDAHAGVRHRFSQRFIFGHSGI
jgi:hypothetical protein